MLTAALVASAALITAAGQQAGTGYAGGLQKGMTQGVAIAVKSTALVNAALMAGRSGAYSAGAYISQGFAQGMLSCLAIVQSAATRLAAAAEKAVKAKAKIHSPSKVADKLGSFWGDGFIGGILGMTSEAWAAAEQLVSVPNLAVPDLAMAYSGELSSEYDYYRSNEFTIEVPLAVDGKEFAKATATYTQEELNTRQRREDRKKGRR